MTTFTLSEARARLSEVLDLVESGEEIEITRHGRPAARVVGPRTARTPRTEELLVAAERLRSELDAARHRPLSPPVKFDISTRIQQLRADRESR